MLAGFDPLPPGAASTAADDADPHDLLALLRGELERRLGELLPAPRHADDRVAAAMRYGTLAPGKRIRPLLLLLAARGLGTDPMKLLDVACALEMVHAASLLLDDMPCMDDAELRRGQPTVHVAYGEDVALLAVVALLACAWRATAACDALPAPARAAMVAVLSDAIGTQGLVAGQYRDLHELGAGRSSAEAAEANRQKTGALFIAAFEIACLAAGSPQRDRELLRQAGDAIGQAFQLADDLADRELDTLTLGKDSQQDAGKPTLVQLLGLRASRRALEREQARALRLLGQALPADRALRGLAGAMLVRRVPVAAAVPRQLHA